MDALATMPTYEDYKDSGVDWLGQIPSEWNFKRFKFLLKEVNVRSITGAERLLSLSKYSGVVPKDSLEERSGGAESLIGYKKVDVSDLVINKMQAVNGLLAVSNISGITSPDYSVYRPLNRSILDVKYLGYLLAQPEYLGEFKRRVTGVMEGFIRLYTDDLYAIPSVLPNIETQRMIVDFLDTKTAQIDEAVAIKEKQIALLKERKQIIIQKAVTQGLDPKVAMKDSGVDWIGQIPKHWNLKRLKYVTKIVKRIIGYEGPDVLSITQKGIKIKDIESGEGQLSMDYSKYQVVNIGDFAMNHMDLLTGYVDISKYEGVVSPDYRVFVNTSKKVNDDFLLSIFQLGYQQKVFYKYGQGVSLLGRWRFPADNFNNFLIPIPPIEEQTEIVNSVRKSWDRIDGSIEILIRQIEKLKEYKSTLINSAVMGKIKVA